MKLKLDFDPTPSSKKIGLQSKILLLGSCFSDQIGEYLVSNKFSTLTNPFGSIYNPHSIFKLLSDDVSTNRLVESQGVYYHWDAHGMISGYSKSEVENDFEQRRNKTKSFLEKTDWLIITPGTSFVYVHGEDGIVANCHKVPATKFEKRLLSIEEIVSQFNKLHAYLAQINPDLNILFTVSPVRHIRDGLVENNRSKAILIEAIHSLVDQWQNVSYFPSYEILIDELRDYRFYTEDMVHPSSSAVRYIWDKFVETYVDDEAVAFLSEWNKIKQAINHKPFQRASDAHQSFLKTTLLKLEKMNEKIDVSVEIKQLRNQII